MDKTQIEQKAIKAALRSDWNLAIKLNTELLLNNYESVDVHNRLGKAYSEIGDFENSVKSFEKALLLDPVSTVAQKGIYNSKMNRRAGVTSSEVHKETLLRDLNTSQLIELPSEGIVLEHEYKLISKNDFYILVDITIDKQLKRVSKAKLNIKQDFSPTTLSVKVLEINNEVAVLKVTSENPVFKAEKQQIDPALELEEKDVFSEKKEIERMYVEEE